MNGNKVNDSDTRQWRRTWILRIKNGCMCTQSYSFCLSFLQKMSEWEKRGPSRTCRARFSWFLVKNFDSLLSSRVSKFQMHISSTQSNWNSPVIDGWCERMLNKKNEKFPHFDTLKKVQSLASAALPPVSLHPLLWQVMNKIISIPGKEKFYSLIVSFCVRLRSPWLSFCESRKFYTNP